MNKETLEATIKDEIYYIVKERIRLIPKEKFKIKSFYIAGNCLNREKINDIDIFPLTLESFEDIFHREDLSLDMNLKIISRTKNAITLKNNPNIQLCLYFHKTLEDLVKSFDFAHIQVGAKIENNEITEIYFTDDYVISKTVGRTFYTKSKYPLSSLCRINKYIERGHFPNRTYIIDIINILSDIVERGFDNYDDFKDQLDAVDLGLVPDEIDAISKANVIRLYNLLNKKGDHII